MSHEIAKPTDITIPPTSPWARLPLVGGVLAVVGLAATLGMAFGEETRDRAMFSYLWAYEVFLGLALAAMGYLLIDHSVRAGWGVVVRRIPETMAVTLPVFALLWIPIGTFGMHSLFPWSHESDDILVKKSWFLNDGFFYGRALFYFVTWSVLGWILHSWSVKQDTVKTKEERDAISRRFWTVGAVGIFLYGLTQSFQAIDWLMSLQPHWYSTIFGIYFFAASIQAFFAFTALVAILLQRSGVLKTAITPEHYHDLGKYTFGFTVFWAYIAFSQFMLIWYANLPEETEFYMVRLEGGWGPVSYALPVLHFFLPFFFLLSRNIKRKTGTLLAGAVYVLVMYLLDLYWLIMPNYGIHGEHHGHPHLAPHWLDLAALLGIGGVFLAVFGYFLNRNNVIAINDPRLPESLAHENY